MPTPLPLGPCPQLVLAAASCALLNHPFPVPTKEAASLCYIHINFVTFWTLEHICNGRGQKKELVGRNKGNCDSWAGWRWPVSSHNPCSLPMMAPAQAKAVCATCPKSVRLLPSPKMAVPTGLSVVAEGSSGWLFLAQYGHMIVRCSKQKLPTGMLCSSCIPPFLLLVGNVVGRTD